MPRTNPIRLKLINLLKTFQIEYFHSNEFRTKTLPDLVELHNKGIEILPKLGYPFIHNSIALLFKHNNILYSITIHAKDFRENIQSYFNYIDQNFPHDEFVGSDEWKKEVCRKYHIL